MVPRPQDLVESLSSFDSDTRLRAVRSMKNEIIGSKNKKMSFLKLGAVPRIVEILASENETGLLVQSAATVGSFAYGMDDGVRAILESGGLAHLLRTLSNHDEKVVEAGVRSLKMIFQSALAPRDQIFVQPALERLVALLSTPKRTFSEVAACVLARCCETPQQQEALVSAGALPGLIKLLESPYRSCQEAALDALAALSKRNETVCEGILAHGQIDGLLLKFTKDRNPSVRLLACTCLTNLACCTLQENVEEKLEEDAYNQHKHVLRVLVKLLNEPCVRDEVPEVLSRLTEKSQELQRAAYDADGVRRLSKFLVEEQCSNKMKKGILRALGTLCMDLKECRKQIQEEKAIKPIVAALEDPISDVRAAAAFCVRGLTRSVKDLRAEWIDAGTATHLLKLLKDPDSEVQEMACATICNLVLVFTRVQQVLLEEGLSQIIGLTQSMEVNLRLNAICALKNLSFELDVEKRRQVLQELPWLHVKNLLDDSEAEVQEKAFGFLRNTCNSDHNVIQAVMDWSGGRLLPTVAKKLEQIRDTQPNVLAEALWVASNISTGMHTHREAVMKSRIPEHLVHCLRDRRKEVRLAAVWCVINLTWRDELPLAGLGAEQARNRARALKELGIEEALKELQEDPVLDVRERNKTAMGFFKDLDV